MIEYIFSAESQARLAAGTLVQATTKSGELLPIVRDLTTGRFVEVAKAVAVNNTSWSPLMAANPLNMAVTIVAAAAQMYQNHKNYQSLSNSLNEVHSSLLGELNIIKSGFGVLQETLDKVAENIKFEQHRLEYVKAYSQFIEATKLMKIATTIEDLDARKVELSNARQTLGEALAIYNSGDLLSETSAPGKLRRHECAWAIEQTICLTYQLQNEPKALKQRVSDLQKTIRQNSLEVIESCQTEEELDFIFPELTRIHDHDLAALSAWENQIDWMMSLPAEDLKLLASADFQESTETPETQLTTVTEPLEYQFYQELKQKSHFKSLHKQLLFLMNPELRRESERYVSEQAKNAGFKSLVSANLQKASHMTVANLYWYFKVQDDEHHLLPQ